MNYNSMCPFVDDLNRADALPEQPPDGAMSYNEFVRSRSDDPEMRTLEAMINHMIANEIRAQEIRETIYQEIRTGRKDIYLGCHEIFSNERNASCQRVGFLLGHATAFRMSSDILTGAQTFFAGQGPSTQVASTASVAVGADRETNDDTGTPLTNGVGERSGGAEAQRAALTNGVHNEIIMNGLSTVNGDIGGSADPALTISPDGAGSMA